MNLDDYAVLLYADGLEYWVTFAGHAHTQPLSGSVIGGLGRRHGQDFHT